MPSRVRVTFVPSDVMVWVEPGVTVIEAARAADIVIPAPCGGRGVCGSCSVRVISGELAEADATERAGLARAPKGFRLACRARIASDVVLRPVVAHRPATAASAGSASGPLVAGVDLGTTGVAAAVIDPGSGREIGRASVVNRQASWGADVLSRLAAASAGHARELQQAAEESVAEAVRVAAAGVSSSIERVVIAGNSAMAGLLSGADVAPLATHPFAAPVYDRRLHSTIIADALAPGACIELLPPVAGFVGGDTVAVLASLRADTGCAPTLVVDIGTNAEVALVGPSGITVASAAAGPAFDGAGVSCGGPAVPGAVERVTFTPEGPSLGLIPGGEPVGWLCGSGLVSALAGLLAAGCVTPDGRMVVGGALADRFVTDGDGVAAVRLGTDDGCPRITQLDVRALQLAKGAVRTAITSVLSSTGTPSEQIGEAVIAGAFGAALSADDLISIGVLPRGLSGRCTVVGNASLTGAIAIALDPHAEAPVEAALASATHLSLAEQPGFSEALLGGLSLEPYDA